MLYFKKIKIFFAYGNKTWVEDIPKGYYIHKHTIPENSVFMNTRNSGITLNLNSTKKIKLSI
jgi:hypothetical protein